ncbi:helix-turn-helix domain-containing protein [Pedobacter sp. UC225_65]|uniref:helix-turn-helix domain-containing protein n=1 Tax=Pedobacter sp. UC225_65 TaxID=3350173 RepID=UPI0036710DC4
MKQSLHLAPFFLFAVFFTIAYFGTDMNNPWESTSFKYYQNSFIVIAISLLSYSIYIIRRVWRFGVDDKPSTESLILSIAAIYILISLITSLTFVVWGVVYFDMGIDYRLFAYALLLFSAIAIVWYWVFGRDNKTTDELNEFAQPNGYLRSYTHSALSETLAITYKDRITSCFNDTTIYLDSNLSLELLAKDLQIPKHYLSQLFNVYFKKSFHSFVAEYRIKYVLELLNTNNGRLKIESLAYSCGFNSKTSFNRYFKEKTGFTPSAYQVQLNRQSA